MAKMSGKRAMTEQLLADAYARLARRPVFLEVHTAPGLGNAMGMMHNAAVGKTS